MRGGVRLVLGLAGAMALLVALALLAVRLYPADRHRAGIEQRLSDWLGVPVRLGSLTASVWGRVGLLADGLEIGPLTGPAGAAGAVLTAGSVRLRVALWPLLRGDTRIHGLDLRDAKLTRSGRRLWDDGSLRVGLERLPDGVLRIHGSVLGILPGLPGSPPGSITFDSSLEQDRLDVRVLTVQFAESDLKASGWVDGVRSRAVRLEFDGEIRAGGSRGTGSLEASLGGDPPAMHFELVFAELRGEDLAPWLAVFATLPSASGSTGDTRSAASRLLPFRISGRLRATRAGIGSVRIDDLLAILTYAKGQIELPDVRFALYGGTHSGSLTANLLSHDLPFRLASRLDGVDVGRLSDALAGEARRPLEGTASLTADLSGNAPGGRPDRNSVRGTAGFEVVDGRVLRLGVLAQVSTLADRSGQRAVGRKDTPFRFISARFSVGDGQARTSDLALHSEEVDLSGSGSVALDGGLDLDLVASLAPAITASLEQQAPGLRHWNGADGRLEVPLRVAGSLEEPRVKMDLDRAASRGLSRYLEEKGKKGVFRRLLGGR